jgi:hypothetical protein
VEVVVEGSFYRKSHVKLAGNGDDDKAGEEEENDCKFTQGTTIE